MRYIFSFFMFLFATLFQGSLVNIFAVFNITPNIVLCLVVMFSFLYNNEYHGLIWGTVFGLISDVIYMPFTGVSALGYFLISLFVIFMSDTFNRENMGTAITLTSLTTIAFNLYSYAVANFLGGSVNFLFMLSKLPMMIVYNAVVGIILYQIFIRKVVRFRNDRYFRY